MSVEMSKIELKPCPFCERLSEIQLNHNRNHYDERYEMIGHRYLAALVSEVYYEDDYRGKSEYGNYDLNFCPVCGKSLKEN